MTSVQHATPVGPEMEYKSLIEKSVTKCQQTSKQCILKQNVWTQGLQFQLNKQSNNNKQTTTKNASLEC